MNIKNLRVLVTGAAGFIGSAVCKRLLYEGLEVVGIDNINNYYFSNFFDSTKNELDTIEEDIYIAYIYDEETYEYTGEYSLQIPINKYKLSLEIDKIAI